MNDTHKPKSPIEVPELVDPTHKLTSNPEVHAAFTQMTDALMKGDVDGAKQVANDHVNQSAEAQADRAEAQEIANSQGQNQGTEVAKNEQPDSHTQDEGFSRS